MILFLYAFVISLVNINCNELYSTSDTNTPYDLTTMDYNTPPPDTSAETGDIDSSPIKTVFELVRGTSVDMWITADNVAYCKLVSPREFVLYDHFGPCRLSLKRVTLEHHGRWEMHVGYPVKPTFEVKYFEVHVIEPEPKTKVHTVVEESSPNTMIVTCSLPSEYQVQGCKFRGPHDKQLFASGITENMIKINETSYNSRLKGSECSFSIINPTVKDLGFWRCAMYTEQDNYYGYVTILSSWFLHEFSIVAAIRHGPLLRADHEHINVYEDEPVTMSCSIDAPIRYCYFWSTDGSVYNVVPELNSSSMEYVGSGFDAGECGLKLYDLNYTQLGRRWSCNVALATGDQQSRDLLVYIQDRMEVFQESFGSEMILRGKIENSQLEYCRFVQDGGYGFPYDNTPPSYEFVGSLAEGNCALQMNYPDTWADYSPWTIVAKVKGEDEEISRRTRGLPNLIWYPPNVSFTNGLQIFGWVMLNAVVVIVLLRMMWGPLWNGRWIARLATIERQGLQRQQRPPYIPTD